MKRLFPFPAVLVVFYLVLFSLGCGGGSSPTTPPTGQSSGDGSVLTPQPPQPAGPVNPLAMTDRSGEKLVVRDDRVLFGIWDIGIDPTTREVTAIPNRTLEQHWDVTFLVTPPNCTDCLGIRVLNIDMDTHIFSIEVSLRNPTRYITGYDVRGTLLFPAGDNRELVNADGFTKIFAGDVISPFKAFAKDQPQWRFIPGAVHYEQYDILFPPPANLYVTYVIDACWPGNQDEPYLIDNEYLDGGMNECNSAEGWIYCDVYDWQDNISSVQMDFTPLGGEVVEMEHVINDTYRTYINNEYGVGPGDYKLWITAWSEGSEWALYDFFTLTVEECTNWPPQWDDTVGIVDLTPVSGGLEVSYGTATDSDVPVTYNIYLSEDDPIEWTTTTPVNDADGSPYVIEGLSDDHVYWVGVRAMDSLNAEEKNTVQMSGTPSNPPEWIDTIGITGCNPMDHAVEVLYGVAVDPQVPVTYNVYWSDTSPIDFDTAGFVNDTGSPTIVPVPENFVEYYFAVRAIDAVGAEDANTNELPCTANGAPEWVDTIGIQSTQPGHESVTVTYGEAIDIDLPIVYNVYYSPTTPIDFDTAPFETDPTGSPTTIEGLPNGVTHYFAVRAEDSLGNEETNIVELPGTPNSAPTWENDEIGVQLLVPFDHEVTVHYGHAIDPDIPITYYIYYSDVSPIDFDTAPYFTTTDESPYLIDSLENYVPIFIAVRAEDSLGIMDQNTNTLSTIPNPAPIWDDTIGVQLLEPGNQQIVVHYGTAHDLDMPVTYRVYYSETSPIDFGTAPYVDDADGSPTVVAPLENGRTYYIAVRAVDSFGHEDQNTVTLSAIPAGMPQEVWSVFTGGVVQGSPVFADMNDDTVLDVIVGDQANRMVVYSGVDGSEIWSFPTGGWVDSSPALGNMNDDAYPDVIFGSLDKNVYCVDGATGTEIWHHTTLSGIVSSPTLANIKDDFHMEVIVGSLDGSVYALNYLDGSVHWTYPTGAGIFSSPANADITGDDIPDIVVGSRDGNVYAINGVTGGGIWTYLIGEWVNSSPALTDLNGDTVPDAVIAGLDGDVHAIDGATGGNLWTYPTGAYIWTSPALGYLDGDAVPDIVLGADSSDVYALSGVDGSEIWTFPSMDRIWSSAALVDINDDDIPDAMVGSDDGYLYGIDGDTGGLMFSYHTGDWIDSSPAVDDIDSDGLVNIAFGRFDGYVTLVEVEDSTLGVMSWPMFRKDREHTAAW